MLGAGLNHENPRVVQDRPRLERAGRDRRRRERQIEHASLERAQEVEVDRRVDDLDPYLGMTRTEPANDVRQDADPHALVRPDAQVATDPSGQLLDVDLGGVEPRHDRVEMTEEDPARLGRAKGSTALLARDDLRPDDRARGSQSAG